MEVMSQTNLGDDLTTSAIAVGWTFTFEEYDVEEEVYDEVLSVLDQINKENKTSLALIVPGDTSETGIIPNVFIIGETVVELFAEEEETPLEFSHKTITNKLTTMPKLDKPYFQNKFKDLSEKLEHYSNKAKSYLLSWGPLCYGSVCIGNIQANENIKYKFIANQDYNQQWSSIGLDGKSLKTVEFTDIAEFNLSEKQYEKDKQKVEKINNASYLLTVRYD